ncbi:unnamed protein product [Ectocarpus sp. 8 AP-2014]
MTDGRSPPVVVCMRFFVEAQRSPGFQCFCGNQSAAAGGVLLCVSLLRRVVAIFFCFFVLFSCRVAGLCGPQRLTSSSSRLAPPCPLCLRLPTNQVPGIWWWWCRLPCIKQKFCCLHNNKHGRRGKILLFSSCGMAGLSIIKFFARRCDARLRVVFFSCFFCCFDFSSILVQYRQCKNISSPGRRLTRPQTLARTSVENDVLFVMMVSLRS